MKLMKYFADMKIRMPNKLEELGVVDGDTLYWKPRI